MKLRRGRTARAVMMCLRPRRSRKQVLRIPAFREGVLRVLRRSCGSGNPRATDDSSSCHAASDRAADVRRCCLRPLPSVLLRRVRSLLLAHPDAGALPSADNAGHRLPALFVGQAEPPWAVPPQFRRHTTSPPSRRGVGICLRVRLNRGRSIVDIATRRHSPRGCPTPVQWAASRLGGRRTIRSAGPAMLSRARMRRSPKRRTRSNLYRSTQWTSVTSA